MNMLMLLILVMTVFAFAGVEPLYSLKNKIFEKIGLAGRTVRAEWDKLSNEIESYSAAPNTSTSPPTIKPAVTTTRTPAVPAPYQQVAPSLPYTESKVWENYNTYIVGGDYQPIILRNYKDAKDPTWQQLLNFLREDDTDGIAYSYPSFVCADFAERLHNNAEKAGLKCAYVSLDMEGYTDPYNLGIKSDAGHACNAFNTTDRGIVYIDCTGNIGNQGPPNNDMIAEVQIGKQYNLSFLFPSGGWYVSRGEMGIVTDTNIHW